MIEKKTVRIKSKSQKPAPRGGWRNAINATDGIQYSTFDATLGRAINDLADGTLVEMDVEKNDKGFWAIMSVPMIQLDESKEDVPTRDPEGVAGEGQVRTSADYWNEKFELDKSRFEEEKMRQSLIVRQSCLSTAVAAYAGTTTRPDDITALAAELEKWVWRK